MITIKNNGSKIVHISKHALMPGDEMNCADKVQEIPSIKALANHGILTVSPFVEKAEENKPAEEEKTVEVEAAPETAETVEAPKKRGRKPAAAESTVEEPAAE